LKWLQGPSQINPDNLNNVRHGCNRYCRGGKIKHLKDKIKDLETDSNNWNSGDFIKGKGKGKAVPLQAWSGPEGSRKLRFPDFMKTAQDGGKVFSLKHWPRLPPGNTRGTHFC
jgi:hypothetical protein